MTAIDPDARALDWALRQPAVPGLVLRRVSSADLAGAGERFDVVTSNHVLHHLDGREFGALLADSERLAGRRRDRGARRHRAHPARLRRVRPRHAAVRAQPVRGFVHPARRPHLDPAQPHRRRARARCCRAGWRVRRGIPSRLEVVWGAPEMREPDAAAHEPPGWRTNRGTTSSSSAAARWGCCSRCLLARRGDRRGRARAAHVAAGPVARDRHPSARRAGARPRGRRAGGAGPSGRDRRRTRHLRGARARRDVVRARAGTVLSLPQLETEEVLERRLEELRPGAAPSRGRGARRARPGHARRGGRRRRHGRRRGVDRRRAVRDRGRRRAQRHPGAARHRLAIRIAAGRSTSWATRATTPASPRARCCTSSRRASSSRSRCRAARVAGSRGCAARPRRRPRRSSPTIVRTRTDDVFDESTASEPSAFEARQHLAERMAQGRVALGGRRRARGQPHRRPGHEPRLARRDAARPRPRGGARRRGAVRGVRGLRPDAARVGGVAPCARPRSTCGWGRPRRALRLRVRNGAVRFLGLAPFRALLARAFTMRWL